jgi:hypothetical protein
MPSEARKAEDAPLKSRQAKVAPLVHSAPNGTVAVKMHKRRRLTLVVPREELDAVLIERIEALEHENRMLRRKVTALTVAAGNGRGANEAR